MVRFLDEHGEAERWRSLFLDAVKVSERRTRAIGDVIARSLRRAGLSVEWEGDTRKRVVVR